MYAERIREWIFWMTFAVNLVGNLGNLLSIVVFTRPNMRKSSVNVLLCALSVADLLIVNLQFANLLPYALNNMKWLTGTRFTTFADMVQLLTNPPLHFVCTVATYTMVLTTLERWVAVCRPLQARQYFTAHKSKKAVLYVVAFSFVFNVFRVFDFKLVAVEGKNGGYYILDNWLRGNNRFYTIVYHTILPLIVSVAIPFTVLAVGNSLVVMAIYQGNLHRRKLSTWHQREQNTTLMLLLITLCFAACNVLPIGLLFFELLCPPEILERPNEAAYLHLAVEVSTFLIVCNSSSTFVLYLKFSEKYRRTAYFLLKSLPNLKMTGKVVGCRMFKKKKDTFTPLLSSPSRKVTNGSAFVRPPF